MNTIISKRTTPFVYQKMFFRDGRIFQDGPGIIINGGSGLVGGAELLSGRPLEKRGTIIPVGVYTFVDDDVLDKLMSIKKFTKDIERGLIAVVRGQKITDQSEVDKIAENDLLDNDLDPSRPFTEDDLKEAGAVKVNKRDGVVEIDEDTAEDIEVVRRENAGASWQSKKANKEARASKKRGRKAKE